jgi:transcription termination/antitermination protein NusG
MMADKKWYVVHAYSGFEKSVQRTLLERIKRSELQDQFGKILVPVEEVVEMKSGQKAISERKFFPGYVLVKMDLTDEAYHLIKNTPKVTGFLGADNKPKPISDAEAARIMHQVQEGIERPKPSVSFEVGEQVRVSEGPFASFNGVVEEVDEGRSRLKVAVSIFGRPTRVELEMGQVEKL